MNQKPGQIIGNEGRLCDTLSSLKTYFFWLPSGIYPGKSAASLTTYKKIFGIDSLLFLFLDKLNLLSSSALP